MLRLTRCVLAGAAFAAALSWPVGATASAADQVADNLELVSLTTRTTTDGPANSVPFQAVVKYQLHTASDGFLLLFPFENSARSSTFSNSTKVPVQSGTGQVSLTIDYTPQPGVQNLTLMVALFKSEQELLTWVATKPIDLAPWPGRAAFNKAMAARQSQDYAGADQHLSAAIEASPDIGNYYYWRGDTRMYLNQFEAAIQDFSRSVDLMPEDRASRVGRGIAVLWSGDAQAALSDLTFAIERGAAPDLVTAFAYRARGTANARLTNKAQAISDYRAYLALLPDAPDRSEVEGWIADLN